MLESESWTLSVYFDALYASSDYKSSQLEYIEFLSDIGINWQPL